MKTTTMVLAGAAAVATTVFARKVLTKDAAATRRAVETRCDAASRELQQRIELRDRLAA